MISVSHLYRTRLAKPPVIKKKSAATKDHADGRQELVSQLFCACQIHEGTVTNVLSVNPGFLGPWRVRSSFGIFHVKKNV